jgi:hypothetical protein
VDDYETWIEGGVMPTLNAFDNGDVRTTVIVFHPHYHLTELEYKEIQ